MTLNCLLCSPLYFLEVQIHNVIILIQLLQSHPDGFGYLPLQKKQKHVLISLVLLICSLVKVRISLDLDPMCSTAYHGKYLNGIIKSSALWDLRKC